MTLTPEERTALVELRISRSKETMLEIEKLVAMQLWNTAANRLYYASFYMATALLISKGISAQTHSGVMTLIGLNFVRSGLLAKEHGKVYSQLFELRQEVDYGTLYPISDTDVVPLLEPTQKLLDALEALIER